MELMNQQAESLVLAGILRNPEAYWTINDVGLTHEDFLGVENRRVMRAIQAVAEERQPPELPLVIEELRLDDASTTIEYLNKLISLSASTAQASEYARTVKGLATSRQLVTAGARIIEIAREKRADSEDALTEAEQELRKVRSSLPPEERSPDPADILLRIRSAGPTRSIPIRCVPTLQNVTGGLIPGHVWVIGGFSSTGKSAVLVNLALDALRERKWVGIFSIEMTQEQYLLRFLSVLSGVPQLAIRDKAIVGLEQIEALGDAEKFMRSANLRIYDTLYRLQDIRSKAVQMKETLGLDVMAVDFIQNVHVNGDEVADARATILELQNLAKELDCTVLALSQVSNEMAKWDTSGGNRNFYSFKGHGGIRDAADVAIMLKRDRAAKSPVLDMDIVKHRHGNSEVIPTYMDLPTGRITEAYDLQDEEDEDD